MWILSRLLLENYTIKTEVYRTVNKFSVYWKSEIPKRYKRNAINGGLYHSWRISSNFCQEKSKIRNKFSRADYPMRFVNNVKNGFERKKHDPIITNYLFNDYESNPIALIDVPYCTKNEKVSKEEIKKVRQLFPLKEKNPYPSCKIYEGVKIT